MVKDVELVGFDKFTYYTIDKIKSSAYSLIRNYNKIFGEKSLLAFKLKLDKTRVRGEHKIYEVKGYMETTHGLFYASSNSRKILDAVDEVVEELRRQIIKKKEKLKK